MFLYIQIVYCCTAFETVQQYCQFGMSRLIAYCLWYNLNCNLGVQLVADLDHYFGIAKAFDWIIQENCPAINRNAFFFEFISNIS